jgi:cytochrome P450
VTSTTPTPRTLDQLQAFANTDPEYLMRPLDVVDQGRKDWCATDPFGTLLIWDHHMVLEALDHPDLWAASIEQSSLGAVTDGPAAEWARLITSFSDGREHRRQRAAIGPAFRRQEIDELRPSIRRVAQAAVTSVATGDVDLVADLCFRVPLEVFAAVLGTSADRLAPLHGDVAALSRLWGYDAGAFQDRIAEALPRVSDLATEIRSCPMGVVERIEQVDLDEDRRQALVMQLIVAGWETTASQAACILWTLMSDDERWRQLTSGEHTVAAIVKESTRWQPSASGALRFAHTDTVLGDVAVPAGTRIFASFLWASRDRGAYGVDAAEWRPARYAGPSPAPAPLAFGAGRHTCLGEHLAVMELEELVAALTTHGPATGWELTERSDWTDHRRPRRPLTLLARPAGS